MQLIYINEDGSPAMLLGDFDGQRPQDFSRESTQSEVDSITAKMEEDGTIADKKERFDHLVLDNFQDGNGNAPFSLIIRNSANVATTFEAQVIQAPYKEIPSLEPGNYIVSSNSNKDDTHNHIFSGVLNANQSITIRGGTPSPAGVGRTDNSPIITGNKKR